MTTVRIYLVNRWRIRTCNKFLLLLLLL